jgi:predicted ribosome quality control (RQC) complex YloA/Tae2 family protein
MKEKYYYYGNEVSEYGVEHGRVDYATLSKCFDAVLNNDIMNLTYDIGCWEQVSGTVDNSDEIEELEEKRDELEDKQKDLEDELEEVQEKDAVNEKEENKIIVELKQIESEIDNLNDQIEQLENEQDNEPEIFQYYIVDDWGGRLLQEVNEIVYYNETLDMYLWGVTHYGTSWDYVLTNIPIEKE